MTFNKLTATLAAAALFGLAGATPAVAQGMQEQKEISYEFSFQYDKNQMTSRQDVQATQKRLRAQASQYCRKITAGVNERGAQRGCVRELVREVNIEMADSASNKDRYAAR